jgi:hypothetical protein
MKFIQEIQSFMNGNKNNNSRGKNDFAKKEWIFAIEDVISI